MNDKKIDDLLNEYSQSLGHSRHVGSRIRAQKLPSWKPVLVTAIGAAAISVFVLTPRRAEAASMDKVLQAFNSAHFWSSTTTMRELKKGADWQISGHQIYLDGTFQQSGPKTTPGYLTIITKSGLQYFDYENMPCILKLPFEESEWSKNTSDPLKQAIFYSKFKKGELVRKDGVRFKGVNTYTLTVAGKDGRTLFQAMVDRSNNLPLQFTMVIGSNNDAAEIKSEYQYKQPRELVALSPNPKKDIIDIKAEKALLASKWNSARPNSDQVTLLSSTVSPDGTIWIATKVEGDKVGTGVRTISLDNPNYTSATYQTFEGLKIKDPLLSAIRDVAINRFVPIYDKPLPTSVTVKVGAYSLYNGKNKRPALGSISCSLTKDPYNFPQYMSTTLFSVSTYFNEGAYWRRRGDARQKLGDYKGAIEGYMKGYEIDKLLHTFFSPSFNNLKSAADCYDKLGDKASAQKVRKMIPTGPRPHF